jgi:UDP-N-acetylmuramate: L-alanyl-gamma-D-glutamyl-meso-diaminopimelate ligase
MHVHILGIGGTFMAGLARLAMQLGYRVTGSDEKLYPPMSDQLREMGIEVCEGYQPADLQPAPDWVIVGNAMKRGNPALEYVLDQGLPYVSGPAWLADHVLQGRQVIAVSGTHGKTTTTALLTWVLRQAGIDCGYLVGGLLQQGLTYSADLGRAPYFVIEADEYDSAYFDKRPKFMHYRPSILLLNNIEFDHADIYADLAAIKQQFHWLVRTVPSQGMVVHNAEDAEVEAVLQQGLWSRALSWGLSAGDWQVAAQDAQQASFEVRHQGQLWQQVQLPLCGEHNVKNALAVIATAQHIGVSPQKILAGLASFPGVARRLQRYMLPDQRVVYDDFAHHPTAIATTLAGLRAKLGSSRRLVAVIHCASYTMREHCHQADWQEILAPADVVYVVAQKPCQPALHSCARFVCQQLLEVLPDLQADAQADDVLVMMGNRSFAALLTALRAMPIGQQG